MLKVIPPSDISIRPFKAYKEWHFNEASSDIYIFDAESSTYDDTTYAIFNDTSKLGVWDKTDLEVDRYRNGDIIPQITNNTDWSTAKYGAWCYYGLEKNDTFGYGKYYNWYAVNDSRGLAPIGRKIPTRYDYADLSTTFDPSTLVIPPFTGGDTMSTTAGGYFKSELQLVLAGYINEFGVGALYGVEAYYWTSDGTVVFLTTSDDTLFFENNQVLYPGSVSQFNWGSKVRCVRYDSDIFPFSKNGVYHQLKAQFYNGNDDNPFLRFGNKSNEYNADDDTLNERYLSGSAKVISIPQSYIGEGIKKNSVEIVDNYRNIIYNDDGYGNLITYTTEPAQFTKLDFGTPTTGGDLNFESSIFGNVYSGSLEVSALISGSLDLSASGLFPTYPNLTFLYNSNVSSASFTTLDLNTGIASAFSSSIYTSDNSTVRNLQGNVFYAHGLITFTKTPDKALEYEWDLTYKSTKTIYEHEYLLVAKESEFNVSTNPSAIKVVGDDSYDFTDSQNRVVRVTSYPGVSYIRKKTILENGDELDYRYTSSYDGVTVAGFEHYDISGSIDKSGSFLTPYVTTIGLYDNNADLLAVAKLPQPIKIYPDIPVNFIVRFDT